MRANSGLLLFGGLLFGQALAQFEVAVIRPSAAAPGSGTSFNLFEGGRVRITNEPVKLLLRVAFQLQNAQIAGGPAWLETDRYDIEAKTGRPQKPDPGELMPLFQSLLADRFGMRFHRETRELTAYALTVAKDGPKFKPKVDGDVPAMNTHSGPGKSRLIATSLSMELLAGYGANRIGRIVVDKTGLRESYNLTLEWAPDEASDSTAPSLNTALREQLGLRLEPRKTPLDVLVIDRLLRPAEN